MSRLFAAADKRLLATALFILLTTNATHAQVPAMATKAGHTDPLDAAAAVPPLTYESSFNGYRLLGNDKVGGWKEANDNVGRIGGWRVYAREAAEPIKPAAMPPAAGGHTAH